MRTVTKAAMLAAVTALGLSLAGCGQSEEETKQNMDEIRAAADDRAAADARAASDSATQASTSNGSVEAPAETKE